MGTGLETPQELLLSWAPPNELILGEVMLILVEVSSGKSRPIGTYTLL
jgi:hypothetical protein